MATPRTALHLSRAEGRLFLSKAPRKSRYTVVPKEHRTIDGIVFASSAEAQRYAALKLRERLGEISALGCQVEFRCEVNGIHILNYAVDFAYREGDAQRYEEVKSWRSGAEKDWRIRRKLVEAIYGVKIDVVTI